MMPERLLSPPSHANPSFSLDALSALSSFIPSNKSEEAARNEGERAEDAAKMPITPPRIETQAQAVASSATFAYSPEVLASSLHCIEEEGSSLSGWSESSRASSLADGGWIQCTTPDGVPYWYNSKDGSSQWEVPSARQIARSSRTPSKLSPRKRVTGSTPLHGAVSFAYSDDATVAALLKLPDCDQTRQMIVAGLHFILHLLLRISRALSFFMRGAFRLTLVTRRGELQCTPLWQPRTMLQRQWHISCSWEPHQILSTKRARPLCMMQRRWEVPRASLF